MLRLPLLFPALLAIALCASGQISTQQDNGNNSTTGLVTTRSIVGRVVSASGSPVPGAVVLIKDGKTLQVRSYIAQGEGSYHFFGLSTDVNYTLRAENGAFTSKEKTVGVFDSHKVVKLDLKLSKKKAVPKDAK